MTLLEVDGIPEFCWTVKLLKIFIMRRTTKVTSEWYLLRQKKI